MRKLVTISQLSKDLGVTVRRLEVDVKDGMPISKVGPRNTRFFDVDVCRQWRRTNRRQVFGEGRSRESGDLLARRSRLLTRASSNSVPGSRARSQPGSADHPPPQPPPPEMADLDHNQILRLVTDGRLDQSHARAYIAAVDAMERGQEFRRKSASLLDAADVANTVRSACQRARVILEAGVDSIVSAVADVVPLTDSQRVAVRAAADRTTTAVMRELAGVVA